MVPARAKTIAFDALQGAFILLVMMLVVFPVLWTVLTSFKERVAIFSIPPVWFFKPTIRNYVDAFTLKPVLRALINSSSIAVLTTIISVAAGSMGAYAAARFRFRGSREIPIIVLFGRMIPSITFVVPYFILIRKLGLLDTRLGVILSHIGFNLPFALLLLRSFFASIPRDLEQAAIIDGCTLWGGFWRIARGTSFSLPSFSPAPGRRPCRSSRPLLSRRSASNGGKSFRWWSSPWHPWWCSAC
jgi:multiple sugar transport system permease protein